MGKLRLLGALLAMFLGVAAPAVAAAQEPTLGSLPEESGIPRARPDKTAFVRAQEEVSANAAELSCAKGDQAGCAALGRAFLYGEGRPQNRPVAHILLRESCDAGAAEGCHWLGALLLAVRDDAMREPGISALQRSCDLGSLDGCASLADALESQLRDDGRDPAAADLLRRETCAKGSANACRTLAVQWLDFSTDPAEHARAFDILEHQCRTGEREACATLLTPRVASVSSLDRRALLDLACRADEAEACHELGLAVLAEGSGPLDQRGDALALLDRACALTARFCSIPADIRARPALAESCASGVPADCVTLGRSLSSSTSPLFAPREAARLLGLGCEAGEIAVCGEAAGIALVIATDDDVPAEQAARWYAIGCDGGVMLACESLGRQLLAGERIPSDRPRGYSLLALVCERGNHFVCEELERLALEDPDAPLLAADSRFAPPLTPKDEEEQRLAFQREREAERAANRLLDCTTSEVSFRGATYLDTICDPVRRIRRGYRLRPGQAPWQALLWRPERLGGVNLVPSQQVLCGGALIREGWILTAAHCLFDQNARIDGKGYSVRLGVYNPRADEGVSYPIIRTIAHPDYSRRTLAFDIALVQYDPRAGARGAATNAIARIRVDPSPLEQRPIRAGMPVFTYGWGWTEAENSGSTDHLRGVRMALSDPATCERITGYTGRLQDVALCAGGPDAGQACKGDSGGPLITYGDPGNLPTVIGVLSAGRQCGATGEASRYTRVARVRAWLDSELAKPR